MLVVLVFVVVLGVVLCPLPVVVELGEQPAVGKKQNLLTELLTSLTWTFVPVPQSTDNYFCRTASKIPTVQYF